MKSILIDAIIYSVIFTSFGYYIHHLNQKTLKEFRSMDNALLAKTCYLDDLNVTNLISLEK